MSINRDNSMHFHRRLYAGMLESIRLLKRGDDQQQGTVTAYTLYECLLPGTMVSGMITGASKAWYAGEVVEVRTARGSVLRSTINHPVLSPRGFVFAGSLKPADCLLSDVLDSAYDSGSDNVQNRPARIEQVFQAFSKFQTPINRRPTVFDFHGDGHAVKGNIEVVTAHRTLRVNAVAGRFQMGNQFGFNRRYTTRTSQSHVGVMQVGAGVAATGRVRRRRLMLSLLRSHVRPSHQLTFMGIAEHDSSGEQNIPDNTTADMIEFRRNNRHALSGRVLRNDMFLHGVGRKVSQFGRFQSHVTEAKALGMGSRFDVRRFEPVANGNVTDAMFISKLSARFAGQIAADQVTHVRRFHYEGPVYDLETAFGYYTAATVGLKVFVSNCRRSSIQKGGQTLDGDMNVDHNTVWHIPDSELQRVGIAYLNPADQIEQLQGKEKGNIWQPEATTSIEKKLFDTHSHVACLLLTPAVSRVGVPGF